MESYHAEVYGLTHGQDCKNLCYFFKKRQMSKLCDRFNLTLDSMRKDGTLHLFMKKYMDLSVAEKENGINEVE